MQIALYQPDIAPNTAAILRTAVCFDLDVHIVGTPGFDLSTRALRRAGLDYATSARIKRHASFEDFAAGANRIVLLSTRAETPLHRFAFLPDDALLFGAETAGVPDDVHAAAGARVRIPMAAGARSLNLAASVALVAFHVLAATDLITQKGLQ